MPDVRVDDAPAHAAGVTGWVMGDPLTPLRHTGRMEALDLLDVIGTTRGTRPEMHGYQKPLLPREVVDN